MKRLVMIGGSVMCLSVAAYLFYTQLRQSAAKVESASDTETAAENRIEAESTRKAESVARGGDGWPRRIPTYYHPQRMAWDKNYRLLVNEYLLQRNVNLLRESDTNFARLFALITNNLAEPALATEVVRTAYEDVATVQRLEAFAEEEDVRLEKAVNNTHALDLTGEEKAKRSAHLQKHFANVKAMWTHNAGAYKMHAIARMKRETGIMDEAFYAELFSIPFSSGPTPVSTDLAQNEELFP